VARASDVLYLRARKFSWGIIVFITRQKFQTNETCFCKVILLKYKQKHSSLFNLVHRFECSSSLPRFRDVWVSILEQKVGS
jgi:hypothetical protein